MKLNQKIFATMVAAMTVTPVVAGTEKVFPEMRAFSIAEMNSLFDQNVLLSVQKAVADHDSESPFNPDGSALQFMVLSNQEMRETEGAAAQFVYVGIMAGSRFIAQRMVTQRTAQAMVRRGAVNILAPNRSVAKNIAGRTYVREFSPGPGARYTHYHPIPRNGSHIWYGRPR